MPRLRIREHRWYPNGGEVFDEEYCTEGHLYPEDKRALNLLRRHLTDEQWACLGTKGYFEVVGKMRHYGVWRTHRFRIHNHCVVYEHQNDGRRHWCIAVLEPGLPAWDWMLCMKLLIQGNLRKFYDIAKKRGFQRVSCDQFD